MERRDFLKSAAAVAAIGTSVLASCKTDKPMAGKSETTYLNDQTADKQPTPATLAKPSELQKQWMDLKFGMFIHFGINTYYDMEWSDGTLDPIKFNPTKLNTDQWAETAKKAGMKYLVLITKHHDGFCLWPTKHTDYSVMASPYKKDIVAQVAESCQKYGIKLGLYYSLWDRHEKSHDTNDYAYVDFMKRQLEELLTNYGPVVELWFDGFWKKQKNGWKGSQQQFMDAWRNEGAYRWQMDHLYQFIKNLQPNCLVMNNSTTAFPGAPLFPVDIRSGEKATKTFDDKKQWNWLGEDLYLPLQIETTMSKMGKDRFPTGSWFWHEWDDSCVSIDEIKNYLNIAQQMEANLLLNCGVTNEGLLREIDRKTLLQFGG